MGPIEAIALGQSARGITDLVILLGILALNFVAVAKIITKAGYSPKWIWVPLTPVCLWFFTFILLTVDVRTIVLAQQRHGVPAREPGQLPIARGDRLSQRHCHVGVLPHLRLLDVAGVGGAPGDAELRGDPRTTFVPASRSRAGAPALTPDIPGSGAATTMPAHARPVPASAQTLPPPSVEKSRIIYCSWCGNQRASDAVAIHHCGSLDRPAVYCMNCGTPLGSGALTCTSCGTPATSVSRS